MSCQTGFSRLANMRREFVTLYTRRNPLGTLIGVLVGLSLCTAQIVQADGTFSTASLRGTYSYINNAANVASLGLITFDGKGKLTVTIKVNLPGNAGGRTVTPLNGTGTYTVEEAGTGTALIQFDGIAETPYDFVITQSEKLKKPDSHPFEEKETLLLATEVFAVSQSGGLNGQLVAPTWAKRAD